MPIRFRLGTRGSPLALTQAGMVRDALVAAHDSNAEEIEIVVIRTTGDRIQDRPLAEIGGKALWTRELDRALLAGEIDAAVHSMKDVETIRPTAISLAALLPRADVRDRLIGAADLHALAEGATVGTSSPRRRAQLLSLRPDLKIVMLRGNVDTRLAKLHIGEVDATLLAAAGLDRLGRNVGTPIATETMLPAPAQGAIGVETRAADQLAHDALVAIDHSETHRCVATERALLAALAADCHSPVAALAIERARTLTLRATLFTENGSESVSGSMSGDDPETIGIALARDLIERASPAVRALFGG